VTPETRAPLGYYWGEDAYSAGRGPEALAKRLAGDGLPLDLVRLNGNSTSADEILMFVATAPMFGGGTLVVVHEPGPLLRSPEVVEPVESPDSAEAEEGAESEGTSTRPRKLEPPKQPKKPRVPEPTVVADLDSDPDVKSPQPADAADTNIALTRLLEVLGQVAPGNGLAFVESIDGSRKSSVTLSKLRSAVAAAGGEVREFKAPRAGDMSRWIGDRAAELGIRISPEAVRLLAERVGANVTEGDIDRRRQGEMVMSELAKLAVYRLEGTIRPEDVKALVAETIPPSVWAFTDAVGMRLADRAARLAEDLADKPAPVLIAILHRRIRELIQIGDLLAGGASAATIIEALKLNPYRAEKLAQQARCWALPELDEALAGLLEMDATFKAREGGSEARRKAALTLWIAEKVRRRG
jgi:DNA polymerase III delta subunit